VGARQASGPTTGVAPAIGVDVGGSAIKLGALDRSGAPIAERSLPPARDAESFVASVSEAAGELAVGSEHAIGLALPGLLDRAERVVRTSPNLPWLAGEPVAAALEERLGLAAGAVLVENDANAAALGELHFGAARGLEDVLVVTLGTGIGGGLVLGGELFVGAGLAGEIGHVVVDPEGPRCGCGARGCLETLASASAARRRAEEAGLPAEAPGDLERLAERAREGAGPEAELLHAVGADLGHGLALALTLLDLRTFVLGGGFSAALDVLEPGIRAGLVEWAYGERVSAVRLLGAGLGPAAGWIGAACLQRGPRDGAESENGGTSG